MRTLAVETHGTSFSKIAALAGMFIGLVAGERGLIAIIETQDDAVAIFSAPMARTSSRIVQYMKISTSRMIWIAQKCGQTISANSCWLAATRRTRRRLRPHRSGT